MIIENHKITDYQGDMINSISKDVKGANQNLVEINEELKNQGDQIINIHDKTNDIAGKVGHTEKVMSAMERRKVCAKVIGTIGIILAGLADIALFIVKLIQ